MSDLTIDDLLSRDQTVLRFTPDDLRGLYLVHFLALEALITRGVYGMNPTDYNTALDAILDLRDRLACEVADQRSNVWNRTWREAVQVP
jgi:hypothetical protein